MPLAVIMMLKIWIWLPLIHIMKAIMPMFFSCPVARPYNACMQCVHQHEESKDIGASRARLACCLSFHRSDLVDTVVVASYTVPFVRS